MIEFITSLVKKEQIKNILGLGSSNKQNYNDNDFYFYLQKNDLTYTYYINHTACTRHQKVRITCR